MSKNHIPIAVQRKVIQLSNDCCEYCLHPESHSTDYYHFDHINPFLKEDRHSIFNIARSCGRCNILKSQKTDAFDPLTGKNFPLYNPRQNRWTDHFQWSEDSLVINGLTEIGRATIELLDLNRSSAVKLRRLLKTAGLHPPKFSIGI